MIPWELVNTTDLVALITGALILTIMGITDKYYRGVPIIVLFAYLGGAIAFTIMRALGYTGLEKQAFGLVIIEVSLFSFILTFFMILTSAIGPADIAVVFITGLYMPFSPVGKLLRLFPLSVMIAALIAAIAILINYRRGTIVDKDLPRGYRRVKKRSVAELKGRKVITEYIVAIIDGQKKKVVYDRVFRGNPVENTKKLIDALPDTVTVYTVPNYPFVWYFAVSYIAVMIILTALGIFEVMGLLP